MSATSQQQVAKKNQPEKTPQTLEKAKAAETFWVRLKPYDVRKKHILRTYMIYGLRFEGERGWYTVPKLVRTFENKKPQRIVTVNLIEALRACHQRNEDTDSPLAFDICTEEEARAIDKAERKAKKVRASAMTANDLSTGDIVRAAPKAAEEEDEDEDEGEDEEYEGE